MDRLSELPDSVLCHILSFLPTELSVRTNILAKRWRFLWTYVPNLDFEDRMGEGGPGPSFSDIVNRVMLLHNVQNLNTFRLECEYDDHLKGYEVETWITTAIFRKVQNLNLCLDYETKLPRCLVTCKTLVDMRLWGCAFKLLSPTSVHLPSLKKLHLHTVTFRTDKIFSHLISGCPVLEELLIDEIKDSDLVCLRISSPTLKRVKINFSALDNSFNDEMDYRLELNAPALEYLNLNDRISKSISADAVPKSLIEANICFYNRLLDVADKELYYDSVFEFVYKLRHVKSLKLSFHYMRFHKSAISASTVRFENLTKLQLRGDWRIISKFIENAENLEVLSFYEVVFYEDFKCWLEARQVPNCLSSHITTIKICNYRDSESEVEMVRYILRNALVLKRMEIYAQVLKEARKFSALQRISLMPRGSATCEVAFYPSTANYVF